MPKGTIHTFTLNSADRKLYPGIAREAGTRRQPDPADPTKMIVATSRPAAYTRPAAVYGPSQYLPGTIAPLIVGANGVDQLLFATSTT